MAASGRGRPKSLVLFGSEVRRYRTATGLSQDQAGLKCHVTGSFIGKIERGETRCTRDLTILMDDLFDTRGALPALWDALVIDAAFPIWFDWPKVEAEATHLQTYQCLVVYGLLQTEDYARALLSGDEEMVRARMSRQQILERESPPPPRLSVLLTEGVLHNQLGDRETMRGQLEHLLAVNSDRVSIQLVPGSIHPAGSVGAFVIATLADRSEIAYVDSAARGLTMGEPDDIRVLSEAYDAIRARALPVEMSRERIRKIMEERWT